MAWRKSRILPVALVLIVPVLIGVGSVGCGDDGVGPNGDGGPQLDTIPPAAVTDLRQRTPTHESIALAWTAPGDDGNSGTADHYEIRHSNSSITEENWAAAAPLDTSIVPTPKPAGEIETIVVTKLPSNTEYYFALKTIDDKDNVSGLSNNASGSTLSEFVPPADVTDLVAKSTGETTFELTWTAPGDDDITGVATQYDIRYSTRSIVTQSDWDGAIKIGEPPTPRPAGETEVFEITGLVGAYYYFKLMTADEADNWSELSNEAPAMGYNQMLWVLPSQVRVGSKAMISFRASPTEITRVSFHSFSSYTPDCGALVLEDIVFETLPDGVHTVMFDFFNDRINNYYEPNFYRISLCWGNMRQKIVPVILTAAPPAAP